MAVQRLKVAVVAIAAGSVLVAGGCSSDSHRHAASSTPPPSTQSASPTGSTPTAERVNPLTGGAPNKNPVVIAKIEDTALGRPQVGIDKADIVYIEQVEGGLTRLMAVFNTVLPTVEPVRSTRANDPELAMEYGPVAYVASGGSKPELAPLDKSDLRADINDRGGPGFSRDPNRPIPNNLKANLALIGKVLKGPGTRNIGLTWSSKIDERGSAAGTDVSTMVGGTAVNFRWYPTLHRYVRYIDGAAQRAGDGKLITTPNVIVQFCRSTVYTKDRDVLGNPAQYTHTIGTGKVVVFRDGRRFTGVWTRPNVNSGTTLTFADHRSIPLSPGGAWFVLTANGTRLA